MSARFHLPVRWRLTLWYTGLLAAALIMFASSVYVLMSRSLLNSLDTSLHQRINQLAPTVDVAHGRVSLAPPADDPDTPYIPGTLLSSTGHPLGSRLPLPVSAWLTSHQKTLPPGFQAASAGGYRVATKAIEGSRHRLGYLLVWQSLGPVGDALRSLLLLMLATGPILLLLAGLGGMLLARRAFQPVRQMTQAASSISATDLQRRVTVSPAHDELSDLASTFNAMIQRLEAAVERERRFTADASHELRSPLAVILAESSLALEEPLDPEDNRRALGIVHDQAAGMQDMITALLMLARSETVPGPSEVIPLADLVSRSTRQIAPAAGANEVRMIGEIAPDLWVEGNETLLTRALRNILDNAVKASPPGGTVRFDARRNGHSVVLQIQDEGPGIAESEQEQVFEPFYQVEKARTPGDSHGLGLAICRRIVRAHGGDVTVSSKVGQGACFTVVLPALEPPIDRPEAADMAQPLA